MKEFFSHYENFAFKALNFRSRATPLEYWSVIPVIWIFIMNSLIGDVGEIYGFLSQREIPPMNPLYYESILIFMITLVPRMALNIRRLHDRNKTGFFILIPMIAIVSSLLLLSGLLGAMMHSSLTGISDGVDNLSNVIHPIALYFSSPHLFWEEMFAVARAFESAGSDAVWGLLAEIYAHSGAVDVRREVANVTTEIEGDTGHTIGFAFVATALVTTPFISTALHMLLNVLPSDMNDNIYGPAKVGELHYTKKKDDTHNPMAGYAHLFEETKEEKARKKEAGQQEVKALYRQRVLGLDPE